MDIKIPEQKIHFEAIYNRYSSNVLNFALRYIYNAEDAQNITQDVFISFYETIERFDNQKDPLPYLLTITRNRCINLIRRNTCSQDFSKYTIDQKKDFLNLTALESESTIKVYNSEVELLLKKGLEKMGPKVRNTFILSRMQGMTNQETARNLGISTRGVEERMRKAMSILRILFKDYL